MTQELTVESYTRQIGWVNGIPTVMVGEKMSERGLKDLVPTALSLPYVGRKVTNFDMDGHPVETLEIEPEFMGMTNAEVMLIKEAQKAAAGNSEATHRLLDRVLGKPKQQNENLNVNASYADFLESQAEQEDEDDLNDYARDRFEGDVIDLSDL